MYIKHLEKNIENVLHFSMKKIHYLLIVALVLSFRSISIAACEPARDSSLAQIILVGARHDCEIEWFEGGGTFQGYVQYIDSLGYPNGYSCGGATVNNGWITWWTCNTCTSAEIGEQLYNDTLDCNKICKQSNLSCIYSYGDEVGQLYGTAYPSCGATDSTIVGCEELESSSSTEEGSSSSGEDEESSSSGAGGGGEEGSSSSGETINPGL